MNKTTFLSGTLPAYDTASQDFIAIETHAWTRPFDIDMLFVPSSPEVTRSSCMHTCGL